MSKSLQPAPHPDLAAQFAAAPDAITKRLRAMVTWWKPVDHDPALISLGDGMAAVTIKRIVGIDETNVYLREDEPAPDRAPVIAIERGRILKLRFTGQTEVSRETLLHELGSGAA